MRNLIFLAAAAVWSLTASAQAPEEVVDDRILSFEGSAAPFEASRGSSPACSSTEYTLSGGVRSARSLGSRYNLTSPRCAP